MSPLQALTLNTALGECELKVFDTDNNITGTLNLLEYCKDNNVSQFVFASTSSVYGLSENMPFIENESGDSLISTYAASKRACELLCHVHNYHYNIVDYN